MRYLIEILFLYILLLLGSSSTVETSAAIVNSLKNDYLILLLPFLSCLQHNNKKISSGCERLSLDMSLLGSLINIEIDLD